MNQISEKALTKVQTQPADRPRIESGLIGAGFWAKYGKVYAGGYRTERGAINAVQRKLDAQQKLNQARESWREASNPSTMASDAVNF